MAKETGNVAATRKVEVFRPGTFTAMNGQSYAFTSEDVDAMVAGYDANGAPAPVVVGHPSHDDPAFGWVRGFEVNEDGTLVAEIGDLAPEFVDAVSAGRYRKISMKFFSPTAANNPKPGTYYPRHVGFLGGAAPAVSGLAPVQFAETGGDDLIEIEFAERTFEDVGGLFRRIREWLIENRSREEADQVLPSYTIQWIEDAAREPESIPDPGFTDTQSEPEQEDPDMDTANAARAAELDKRERALASAEAVAFADGLVTAGKLLPAQRDGAVALLTELSAGEVEDIAFSSDGSEVKAAPAEVLRDLLSATPEVVPMGDVDQGAAPDEASVAFAAPDGLSVDPDGLELHSKALAYQREHPGTNYIDAAVAVQGA